MAPKFSIVSRKAEMIVPAAKSSPPHEMKRVSDVDNQQSLRFYYNIIMFYHSNPSMQEFDPVHVIRQALPQTLDHYYPLAGRLVEGPHHKLMVDCTPEGVVFVEADASVTLARLGNTILPPCPYPDLLPNLPCSHNDLRIPPLLLQVTRFECGGFALAIKISHVLSDATGLIQFLTALSQFAKPTSTSISTPSILPVWERDVLTARCPPRISHTHAEYQYDSNGVVPSAMNDIQTLVRKSFRFGPNETKAIQASLSPEHCRCSKFDLITACLWRSRTRALQFRPSDSVRITCAVSMRGKETLDLPSGYYGNAVLHPAKAAMAGELCSRPLDYAVELVREARTLATAEYSRSAIDYIGTVEGVSVNNPWNFIVSDVSRIGFDEVDLGWGRAVYGGTMDGGSFDMTLYGRYRKDVLVTAMALPPAVMERFEKELRRLISSESSRQVLVSSNL